MDDIGVVDIFSGPGGLGEGFANFKLDGSERRPFKLALSVEKDAAAHKTLLLRSFLRKFEELPDEYYDFLNGGDRQEPDWEELYPKQWGQAQKEVWHRELGRQGTKKALRSRIAEIRKQFKERTILLGGPPCQAYSLVGRSKNGSIEGYCLEKDDRTYLYKEYVKVLAALRPMAFVMENVKGLVSFKTSDGLIGGQIISDLKGAGYELFPLGREPATLDGRGSAISDFIVQSEEHGIPQRRHRVIIVGVRKDLGGNSGTETTGQSLRLDPSGSEVSVGDTILDMPKLRSHLSKDDHLDHWVQAVAKGIRDIGEGLSEGPEPENKAKMLKFLDKIEKHFNGPVQRSYRNSSGEGYDFTKFSIDCSGGLRDWIVDKKISKLPNHEARSHMGSDLTRYLFATIFAEVNGRSPKAQEFPPKIAPKHRNWKSGKFSDRFSVQGIGQPARTVTSHIAKDGHYYIHPDPHQCRSLTVREAARLQTFPDNYFFKGNRTQQYTQVGNAVPPYLARQIAENLWGALAQIRGLE